MESMNIAYMPVLALAILSGLTTLIGTTIAIYVGKNVKGIIFGIGFSAVIMLLISILELLPQAIEESGQGVAISVAALGSLVIALLHWLIPHTHLIEERGALNLPLIRSAYLVMFGLILHDFPEGFALANAFISSADLGLLLALVIALHNIPEEFAMAAPIVSISRPRFLFMAAFISALAEPAGAIIGLFAVHFNPALNSIFMAFAAGAMIYVAIHELLPMVKIYREPKYFVSGGIFSVLVYLLLTQLTTI
jgi:ZIP family zinc transporter